MSGPADIFAIWEGMQGGDVAGHAAIWTGTPESRINLQPPGGGASYVYAMRGDMQVGVVSPGSGVYRAALWRGSIQSYIDLHPSAERSYAYATDGEYQGGAVVWGGERPAIWHGTPESVVDLGPGARTGSIRGMAPGIQVGWVDFPAYHASVWHGTPESWEDWHPPGWGQTRFFATTGRVHVGNGAVTGAEHAVINLGRPDAWVDLHQFLPAGYTSFSSAAAVYEDGNTIYVAGWALRSSGPDEAFLWIGTVPCYPNCDASTAAPALNVLDFNCFLNRFGAGDSYANCDGSTVAPVLNVSDFTCFLNAFVTGCR